MQLRAGKEGGSRKDVDTLQRGNVDHATKRAVVVRTTGTRGGWRRVGRKRSGLDSGTGRPLPEDGFTEVERPADGAQKRGKTGGVRRKGTFRLISGKERMGRKWRGNRTEGVGGLVSEECAPHAGRKRRTTRPREWEHSHRCSR